MVSPVKSGGPDAGSSVGTSVGSAVGSGASVGGGGLVGSGIGVAAGLHAPKKRATSVKTVTRQNRDFFMIVSSYMTHTIRM